RGSDADIGAGQEGISPSRATVQRTIALVAVSLSLRMFAKPYSLLTPKIWCSDEFRRSPSINSTRLPALASAMARLAATVVMPSSGSGEVTRIDRDCSAGTP